MKPMTKERLEELAHWSDVHTENYPDPQATILKEALSEIHRLRGANEKMRIGLEKIRDLHGSLSQLNTEERIAIEALSPSDETEVKP